MRMLACTETITIIRHVKLADGDQYTCEVIEGVSWFAKTGTNVSASGAAPTTDIIVRIPAAVAPAVLPVAGDLIVHGAVGSYTGRQTLDGMEYFRAASVGDNRRGSLQHVVVKSQ